VFDPGETYVPFDWDAETLIETAERFAADESERRRIAENARARYVDQLRRTEARLQAVLEDARIDL
jgi:glycosyltransferase involved in cell wall biosynthesis